MKLWYNTLSWNEDKATPRQIDYPDTKDKDAEDKRLFLSQHSKEKVEELSKKEASGLIETLLE